MRENRTHILAEARTKRAAAAKQLQTRDSSKNKFSPAANTVTVGASPHL